MNKKYLLLLVFFLHTYAHSNDEILASMFSKAPPSFCTYGKSTQGVTIGTTCNANGEKCSFDWSSFADSLSYLKAETNTYQLINEMTTVKGDGRWGVDKGERVHFFDSTGGYRGSDKANTDGNAYKTYRLNNLQTIIGVPQVWVMRWSVTGIPSPSINYQQQMINQQYLDQYGITEGKFIPQTGDSTNYGSFSGQYYCSKKDIILQNKPYLSLSGTSPFSITNASISILFPNGLPIYYEVDWNSKAIKENIPSKITLYARYSNHSRRDVVGVTNVSQQRGSILIMPSGYSISDGAVKFSAEINDGAHSTGEIHLGTFTYVASIPDACAQACPASLGFYKAQCQSSTFACNYRVW